MKVPLWALETNSKISSIRSIDICFLRSSGTDFRTKSIRDMFFGNMSGFFVYIEYTEIAFDIATIAFSLSVSATILYGVSIICSVIFYTLELFFLL